MHYTKEVLEQTPWWFLETLDEKIADKSLEPWK